MTTALHAVLTGDLISSSKLEPEDVVQAGRILAESAAALNEVAGDVFIGPLDVFRGDSWQVVLKTPGQSLRTALFFRARLKYQLDADTRIAIGIGASAVPFEGSPSQATGEAFLLSGHALDGMPRYCNLTVALPDRAAALARWAPGMAGLCDALIGEWTQRQSQIICHAILNPAFTHEELGRTLPDPIAQQTVTRALNGAHWRAVEEAISVFAGTDWNAFCGHDAHHTA